MNAYKKLVKLKGFTLIELLVVIAIIGILSTLAIIALSSARQKARDAKRVTDIAQISKALELYYSDNNTYPALITPGQPIMAGGTTYMAQVPNNPSPKTDGGCPDKDYQYGYYPTISASYGLSYCLGGATGSIATTGGPITYGADGNSLPLMYLRLDDNTGTSAIDSSSNGYTGALANGAAWTTGKVGSAVQFDNTDDFISLPSFGITSPANTLTFAAWVYSTDNVTETLIGDGSQSNVAAYIWSYRLANHLYWQYSYGTGRDDLRATNIFSGLDSTWIHIAVVLDYSNNKATFYRNGELYEIVTKTSSPTALFPSLARTRYIGAYWSSGASPFAGKLDDVRLYNRALSAGEIKAIYNGTN